MKREETLSVIGLLLLVAILSRVLPHVANFASITAIGLFCGAYMSRRVAIPATLLIMLATDYALLYISPFGSFNLSRLHSPSDVWYGWVQASVYLSFGISALVGQLALREARTPARLGVAALFCSLQFFLITNGAVWLFGAYGRGLNGLWESYVAGIPFYRGTVLGDLLYTATFFGLYEMQRQSAQRTLPAVTEEARAESLA